MIKNINDVIDRMRAIGDSTDPRDGIGQFNAVYQRATEAIRDQLNGEFFEDATLAEHFNVVFANRYFVAVDADAAGQPVDSAWKPLFSSRSDTRVQAVQFVIAGMNAHINQDLPLATVEACIAAGTHPLTGTIPADYRKINEILEDIESKTRLSLLNELKRELFGPIEPLIHLISSWNIALAREAAWIRAQVFWLLRTKPRLFDHSVAVSSKAVGMTSRHLLTPLPHPRDDI